MPRSTVEILSEFEAGLISGQCSGIEDYYATLTPEEHSAQLISDLARSELYFSKWPNNRLRRILAFSREKDRTEMAYAAILEGVYADRVECGEQPSLADFDGLVLDGVTFRAPNDPFSLGEHFTDYQIVGRIGAGAFGVVFEGRSSSGKRVAIKCPFCSPNEQMAELTKGLIRSEAAAARQLSESSFPAFVEFIDHENGNCCLVTELVEGHNLRLLLAAEPVVPQRAATIVAEVAEALYFAHSKGFVHRDVKSANVMIRNDGKAILLDFGFAVDDEQMIGLEGQVAGTLGHQSPDAILGNVPDMDARSDVWALGPFLHECLTGKPLFSPEGKEDALTTAIVAAVLPSNDSQIPEQLMQIIQKCVQANPIARFDTARDVALALRRFVDPTIPLDIFKRTPLLAFRIGRELGEAQCHVDAFNDYIQSAGEDKNALRIAIGSLFMVSEEIRHCRLQLAKLTPDNYEWLDFDHNSPSLLFYSASKATAESLPQLMSVSESAMNWLEVTCVQVQECLEHEPKSSQALFELGLAATLPKSVLPRQIRIRRLAELANLPQDVWARFEEFLIDKSPTSFVNDEWRRFSKRVERHFLYGAGCADSKA